MHSLKDRAQNDQFSAILAYIKGINFRRYKFSRVLIFAGINSRNFVKIRENSRKLIPAKYAKMADSRKFAKINPREKFKLLVRENWFHENAK